MMFTYQAKLFSIFAISLLIISFSFNTSFSQVTFSDEILITGQLRDIRSVVSADLDGNGNPDIIAASYEDNEIFWLRNSGGQLGFGLHLTISQEVDGADAVFCADLDDDGDIDVLSASYHDDKIAWYENLDGLGSFGFQQIITTEANGACSVFSVDIDGDGDNDVISAASAGDEISWYENIDGNGNFELNQVITTNADGVQSIFCSDIDGDDDYDVIAAIEHNDKIAWYENTDGLGTFGLEQDVYFGADGAQSVFSTDFDGDGDNDVVSASNYDDDIKWYENIDGLGTFELAEIIDANAVGVKSVFCADLDCDGDNDVLAGSEVDNTIYWYVYWYENTDGLGDFGSNSVIGMSPYNVTCVTSSDLDGDGDMDVVSSSHDHDWAGRSIDNINIYRNMDGLGDFSQPYSLIPEISEPVSVFSNDIDGDGDNDFLVASEDDDKICWIENVDGTGTFSNQNIISIYADRARCVISADLDGDGDYDVLSASRSDDKIAWYENIDGAGSFDQQNIISNELEYAKFVTCGDLDDDGDNDVIAASSDLVTWFENTDGLGDFGPGQAITNAGFGVNSLGCADFDGDGDIDIYTSSYYSSYWLEDSKVSWYENTDGLGSFDTPHIVSNTFGARSAFSADLDSDGDYDIVAGYYYNGGLWYDIDQIVWFENTDGSGNFGESHTLTFDANGYKIVYSADIDNDGDFDILSTSNDNNGVFQIAWYENIDGFGNFSDQQIIDEPPHDINSIICSDLDGDGDNDVASVGEESWFAWYRNELAARELILIASPWEETTIVEPDGGNFRWDVSVENISIDTMIIDAWTGLILPDGSIFEPLDLYNDLTVLPGTILAGSPNQQVPGWAPNGIYSYMARVGDFEAGEVHAQDFFQFAKMLFPGATAVDMTNSDGWILTDFYEMDEPSTEESASILPSDYIVEKPYPNPFNPTTTINIGLPETSFLRINVFNILGQQVAVLVNNQVNAGYHSFTLDGSELTSGVYFIYTNVHGKLDEIRKVVLMK